MKYQQLSAEERFLIAALRSHGLSLPEIAGVLGRDRTTIWREVRRNCAPYDGGYRSARAHERAGARRKLSRRNQQFVVNRWGQIFALNILYRLGSDLGQETRSGVYYCTTRFGRFRRPVSKNAALSANQLRKICPAAPHSTLRTTRSTVRQHMAGLTITFLGTGTSQGVPVIGCDCRVCRSDDPRDKRTRSSIYVQTPEAAWVVDTGTDFRTQCLREAVRTLDAVVYTHSHTDHIMGFDDLRPFCPRGQALPIYASAETMRDLERVFLFAFNGQNRFPGYIHPEPHVIDGPFALGETQLTPLPVPHGHATVYGYLFSRAGERLAAYLSDCKAVPEAVVAQISGVRHLVIDALRHKPHPTHMSIDEALAVVEKVQPAQTWFTHLCHDLRHAELELTLPPTVRIAYDGLRIET